MTRTEAKTLAALLRACGLPARAAKAEVSIRFKGANIILGGSPWYLITKDGYATNYGSLTGVGDPGVYQDDMDDLEEAFAAAGFRTAGDHTEFRVYLREERPTIALELRINGTWQVAVTSEF